jgi:hypothetical protein
MTELLILLSGLVVGCIIGWWASWRRQQTIINGLLFSTVILMRELNIDHKDLDRLLAQAHEHKEIAEYQIRIEQHSGRLYAYTKDTNRFLAQGVDKEELVAEITRLNLGMTVTITEEDGAEYIK